MKIILIKKEQFLMLFYIVIIILGVIKTARDEAVSALVVYNAERTIIIDAGHGGDDPGKVAGKILEKDINLKIAKNLQAYLEQAGYQVKMTREDDDDLANTKQSDMHKRKIIANSSEADIFVSIHQNSHSNQRAQGAQVFYFGKSENSKKLAECIQSEIKKYANPSNKMDTASNTNYYVLRQTVMPAVLVECGFLSNAGERWKLTTSEYQDKMAWAIYKGILRYFEQQTTDESFE